MSGIHSSKFEIPNCEMVMFADEFGEPLKLDSKSTSFGVGLLAFPSVERWSSFKVAWEALLAQHDLVAWNGKVKKGRDIKAEQYWIDFAKLLIQFDCYPFVQVTPFNDATAAEATRNFVKYLCEKGRSPLQGARQVGSTELRINPVNLTWCQCMNAAFMLIFLKFWIQFGWYQVVKFEAFLDRKTLSDDEEYLLDHFFGPVFMQQFEKAPLYVGGNDRTNIPKSISTAYAEWHNRIALSRSTFERKKRHRGLYAADQWCSLYQKAKADSNSTAGAALNLLIAQYPAGIDYVGDLSPLGIDYEMKE